MPRVSAISSHWLFFIFFHLTILNLLPGSMGNRIAGGFVFVLVLSLFCIHGVSYRGRIQEYAQEHRLECLVFLCALMVLLISCLVNFDWQQQRQWPLSAVLMISAVASYAFFILSYWLFRMSSRKSGYEFVLFLFILVHGIALWEYFDHQSVLPLLRNTLRSGHMARHQVSSVLDVSTVYGPFAAVSGIFFLQRGLAKASDPRRRILEWVCAAGGFAGALLAGSRSGLLALAIGLIVLFFRVDGKKKVWIFAAGLLAAAAIHWIAFDHPYVARKMGKILPYMQKMNRHQELALTDFVPRFGSDAMSSRPQVWAEAVELYKQSPWIGIGPGQFNVRSGRSWAVNVNNIYLNILTECGVFVFLVFCYIVLKFIRQRRRLQVFAVLLALAVIGFFDNQYDHSLPWNLSMAWMLANGD